MLFASQWFVVSLLFLSGPFIFLAPKFKCDGNLCTEDNGGCDSNNPPLDPNSRDSITKEFELYCSQRDIRNLLTSMSFIGSVCGLACTALISLPRKKVLTFGWLLCTVGLVGAACSVNWKMFAVFYFIAGFGGNPTQIIHFTILAEQTSKLKLFYLEDCYYLLY